MQRKLAIQNFQYRDQKYLVTLESLGAVMINSF
jgi:hypothetical protein